MSKHKITHLLQLEERKVFAKEKQIQHNKSNSAHYVETFELNPQSQHGFTSKLDTKLFSVLRGRTAGPERNITNMTKTLHVFQMSDR